MDTVAIIPCAGEGRRFGEPKQYVILGGKPIFVHTIMAFENSVVDRIIIVVKKEELEYTKEILKEYGFSKIEAVLPGGPRRQDSVYLGLKGIMDPPEIVLIHDGARPFVTKQIIANVIDGARRYGAAVAAVPITDTIKRSKDGGFIDETIPRHGLWTAQTPQAFRYDLLKMAFERADHNGFYGSDEAMLFERLAHKVRIVMGEKENIKITTGDDLSFAESILLRRA